MMRLVQIQNGDKIRVAIVEEPQARLLVPEFPSIYALASAALAGNGSITALVENSLTQEFLDYETLYCGRAPWRLIAPIHHPDDASRCLVSGTGLTHLGSAKNRENMHLDQPSDLTDSMKMFRLGLEGGKPAAGQVGLAPEWFYKGCGTIVRSHGEPLDVPSFAEGGGEEAEIAGVYFVDTNGQPHRIGMAIGNEFSDHKFEKRNYLNLAGSKIRTCALGPELVIAPVFQSVPGNVTIEREGEIFWRKEIATGEAEMCHSLANIEHHHFKFETHRRPGDLHIHYYGACALSFGDGVELADGDIMQIQFTDFGRPLRNPLRVAAAGHSPIIVRSLA